jgi:hypothetical protein
VGSGVAPFSLMVTGLSPDEDATAADAAPTKAAPRKPAPKSEPKAEAEAELDEAA